MGINPQQIGKLILLAGIIISAVGALLILLGNFGLFKLPGDLEFGGKNWKVYIPITSCVLISLILTLILWLVYYFKR
jgi:ABC-type antimicrobial peptide transport system permease subunit